MADRMDRAQLGEQSMSDRSSIGQDDIERMSSRGQPRTNRQDEVVARPTMNRDQTDEAAGDEGIDESTPRVSEDRESAVESDSMSASDFEGRGSQKDGASDDAQGTGYTNDRTGQLQEDDSLSGSQGRHGRSGSRQGARRITRTSRPERVGGQTAQNPRGSETDDIDRSVM